MSGLACNSCNKDFEDDAEQKFHYKSEWHRYNLKRKVSFLLLSLSNLNSSLSVSRENLASVMR